MGDRALVYVKDAPAALYLHWHGHEAIGILKGAIPRMRCGDPDYSSARLAGHAHTLVDGNCGLGLVEKPENLTPKYLADEYSHGDAGVVVYDCKTGVATLAGGYLQGRHGNTLHLEVPPG